MIVILAVAVLTEWVSEWAGNFIFYLHTGETSQMHRPDIREWIAPSVRVPTPPKSPNNIITLSAVTINHKPIWAFYYDFMTSYAFVVPVSAWKFVRNWKQRKHGIYLYVLESWMAAGNVRWLGISPRPSPSNCPFIYSTHSYLFTKKKKNENCVASDTCSVVLLSVHV